MSFGGDRAERGADHLGGWQRRLEQRVDRPRRDFGEQVFAFVLGELVLLEHQELLGVGVGESDADAGHVDRAGDVQQRRDRSRIHDDHAVDPSAGCLFEQLRQHRADAGAVGRYEAVAPVLPPHRFGGGSRSESGVPVEVLLGHVEVDRRVVVDAAFQLGGAAGACELKPSVVEREFAPVAHQAALTASLGRVGECHQVPSLTVGTQQFRAQLSGRPAGHCLRRRLVRSHTCVVEAAGERADQPR